MSEESRSLVQAQDRWKAAEEDRDPEMLLSLIVKTHMSASTGLPQVDQRRARQAYSSLVQGEHELLPDFKERFDFALKTLEATGQAIPEQEAQAADFLGSYNWT
jgi:hypothetical protein